MVAASVSHHRASRWHDATSCRCEPLRGETKGGYQHVSGAMSRRRLKDE